MRNFLMLSALAVASAFTGRAFAGVTVVSQHATSGQSTWYVDGPHMRMELPEHSGRGSVILIDADTKRQVMIDDKNKSYIEITDEDRKRMRDQMQAMRAQMAERMKNMTPEQRKRMEQAMGPLGGGADDGAGAAKSKPHDWKYESLGAKKTVNGFACDMYRVSEDGHPREEVCVTPWSAGLVKKEDFAGLAKFGQEMMEEMGFDKDRRGESAFFGRLHAAPGLPISRVRLEDDGKRGEEDQIKSIKRGAIPASLFEIPPGYTKKDLPMGMGGGMGGPGARRGKPPAGH